MELNERTKKLDGIHTVRLLFCDAAGIRRARAVPLAGGGGGGTGKRGGGGSGAPSPAAVAASLQALLLDGVGLTQACMAMPAHADMVAPESGLTPVGEVRLVPGRASRPAAATGGGDDRGSGAKTCALLRLLPWPPGGHAVSLADMLDASTGLPWTCCPRAALRRVAAAARRDLGVAFTVGFELEFVLLVASNQKQQQQSLPLVAPGPVPSCLLGGGDDPPSAAPTWRAADDLPYASSLGLDSHASLLDEIVLACARLGQPVVQYHCESAPGQYELALAAHHADPVAAADGALLAKEAIAACCARRGFLACFAPKPFAAAAGSGMHAHISVVSADSAGDGSVGGKNLMAGGGGGKKEEENEAGGRNLISSGEGRGGGGGGKEEDDQAAAAAAADGLFTGGLLSPLGERFVAGLLAHLPALLPFTAPSAGSYERLRPGCWAGAFATYGVENREAPLRITAARGAANTAAAAAGGSGGGGGSASKVNVEVKAVDATANPHTALAAILTAGVLGIKAKARLPGPPLERDPAAAASSAPSASSSPCASQPPLLPASLPEALAALEADAELVAALRDPVSSLGGPLFDALVGVRRCEARLGVTAAQTALKY